MDMLIWLTMSSIISAVNSAVITYNAALNRPAYQSSVYQNSHGTTFPAHYANDGRRHTHYSTSPYCAVTNNTPNPWWAVDLGHLTAIYRVDLTTSIFHSQRTRSTSRTCLSTVGNCVIEVTCNNLENFMNTSLTIFASVQTTSRIGHRCENFIVGLTNVSPTISAPTLYNYTLCGQYPGAVTNGTTVSLYCYDNLPPFRYVVLQLPHTGFLVACEVEVLVKDSNQSTALPHTTTSSIEHTNDISLPATAKTTETVSVTDKNGECESNSLLPAVIVLAVTAVVAIIAGVILYIKLRAVIKQLSEQTKTSQHGVYEKAQGVQNYSAFAPPANGGQQLEMSPR